MFLKIENYMLPCLNKKLFGIDCMGCGIQRSLAFLIHGEFIEAFKMYPAIYSLIILFGFVLLNLRFQFKNAQKIILLLTITSILLIVGNFIIKIV